jgi:hypothetical protein
MANNGIKVDEETFAKMDHDDQIKSIFHAIVKTNENVSTQIKLCEPRFQCLENRKWKDKGTAAGGGVIGGFLAIIAKKLFLP